MPVQVGIDATPLFGTPTGVGMVTRAIISQLCARSDVTVVPVLVSWRAKQLLPTVLSTELASDAMALRFPARLAHQLWRRFDWPRIDVPVMHGTNFVSPPAHRELVTIHDLTAWRFPQLVHRHALGYPTLVKQALNRGAHVHAVSQAVADEVVAELDVEAHRVHTVPNGFDPPPSGSVPAAIVDGRYVLSLGTIEPRKDHPTLLRAMREVWAEDPDLRLVVAGADGWGLPAYERTVASLGIGDDARLLRLGYVSDDDRASLLHHAVCLAYPSVYEGFGLPPLEAMAASTPVVASNIAAVEEVCGKAAILVPVGDASALAAGIVEAADENSALVAAGKTRIKQFSWEDSVDRLVEIYKMLATD